MKAISVHAQNGFSLTETMVTMGIFLIVSLGLYSALSSGRSAALGADTSAELQQNLRLTLEKITRELHESGFDKSGVWQVTLFDGTGVGGSDVLRFSMPVICHNGDNVIDSNGDVAHWGAPLTWGCTTSSCMDADNNCLTVDYRYIEYNLDNTSQLLRKVLDSNGVAVRQDIVAQNISNFQLTNSVDKNIVTLQISAQKKSSSGKIFSASANMDVYLRNR